MKVEAAGEVSKKNPYWIPNHRYQELKHFCRQYSRWERIAVKDIIGLGNRRVEYNKTNRFESNPVCTEAVRRVYYINLMKMVRETANATDPVIGEYIFKGVTEGLSYDHLRTKLNIPCGRNMYYSLYRRFFWLLDKTRD